VTDILLFIFHGPSQVRAIPNPKEGQNNHLTLLAGENQKHFLNRIIDYIFRPSGYKYLAYIPSHRGNAFLLAPLEMPQHSLPATFKVKTRMSG
jgi:hypothetical protein